MKLARRIATPVLAGGVALAGLLGVGPGTANAEPGRTCSQPNTPVCASGPQNDNWQQRGIDQARNDHQPFMHNGQRVEPMRAGNGDGWGFWFLGQWIRL